VSKQNLEKIKGRNRMNIEIESITSKAEMIKVFSEKDDFQKKIKNPLCPNSDLEILKVDSPQRYMQKSSKPKPTILSTLKSKSLSGSKWKSNETSKITTPTKHKDLFFNFHVPEEMM
jgi:hypothetical protein